MRDNIDPLKQYHDHEVYDVLNRCHVVDVVRRMGGLNAQVGSGGSSFSAGQKQLLCLTRAILQNAKVKVVFFLYLLVLLRFLMHCRLLIWLPIPGSLH